MVKLSQSSQLTQQVINFRLPSNQYLLFPTFGHWHFLHSVNDAVKLMSTLIDNAVTALAEDPHFFKVLCISTTEERRLSDIRA